MPLHDHGVADSSDVVHCALDDITLLVAQAIHLLHVEGPNEARRALVHQLRSFQFDLLRSRQNVCVQGELLLFARLDGSVDGSEGCFATMSFQRLLVTLQIRPDDVRRDHVLDVLCKLLKLETVIDVLHFADGCGDLRLAEHTVKQWVLEDATQKRHVSKPCAEAIPRRGVRLGYHEGIGGLLWRPLCLVSCSRVGFGSLTLGLIISLGLLGCLGRLGGNVPVGLPLLEPRVALVFVTEVGKCLRRGVHHTRKCVLRLVEHRLRAGGHGAAMLPHEFARLLQTLALFRSLVEATAHLALCVRNLLLPIAQELGRLR
mmetsp:Transcript_18389/g.50473  ORF Transcript_18389/g.50473 Transcript_18389/m.50473 type:complete len:316 (-) Transcript_18389:359-1306(-)